MNDQDIEKDDLQVKSVVEYFKHELAVVEDGADIGNGTKIWHFAHVRTGAKLGENVIVGKSSFVDTGVNIGSNVKIQNLVSVYHGVTIEDEVFVGPHAVFTNDLHPRAIGDWQVAETLVKKGASIGANATIVCGTTLGSYCLVGAGSVVTKDVPDHALVVGNPARIIGWVCYCARKIADKALSPGNHTLECDNCKRTVELKID